MNLRLLLYFFIAFLFCTESIHAQKMPVIEGQDIQISVTDDTLFTKIDSFYSKYAIDLRVCENIELYQQIFKWYRTCYRYGGNSSKGIDCSHFVNMLYEKVYGKKLNSSAASIFAQCKVVKGGKDEFVEGDLLFFKIKKNRISHVGIYLQHGKFAHASTQAGVIISDLSEAYYKRRFFKAGRIE